MQLVTGPKNGQCSSCKWTFKSGSFNESEEAMKIVLIELLFSTGNPFQTQSIISRKMFLGDLKYVWGGSLNFCPQITLFALFLFCLFMSTRLLSFCTVDSFIRVLFSLVGSCFVDLFVVGVLVHRWLKGRRRAEHLNSL